MSAANARAAAHDPAIVRRARPAPVGRARAGLRARAQGELRERAQARDDVGALATGRSLDWR